MSPVRLKAEILRCSSVELNEGLCLFINELKQQQRELHSADGLFYLCLSIQQVGSGSRHLWRVRLIYQCWPGVLFVASSLNPNNIKNSHFVATTIWNCHTANCSDLQITGKSHTYQSIIIHFPDFCFQPPPSGSHPNEIIKPCWNIHMYCFDCSVPL